MSNWTISTSDDTEWNPCGYLSLTNALQWKKNSFRHVNKTVDTARDDVLIFRQKEASVTSEFNTQADWFAEDCELPEGPGIDLNFN